MVKGLMKKFNPEIQVYYSGDLNSKLVRYLNGTKWFAS